MNLRLLFEALGKILSEKENANVVFKLEPKEGDWINTYTVYKHICPNNKIYIGITGQNPFKRWKNGLGYKRSKHFFNAILKYGWDNIKHEILYAGLTKEEACEKETELIAQYKSNQKKFGYNLSVGGESGAKGSHHTFSDEHKRKMSEAHRGKKQSKEQCLKNGEIHKKPVLMFDCDGNFIKRFERVTDAIRETKMTMIVPCCKGRVTSTKGYVFKYESEVMNRE